MKPKTKIRQLRSFLATFASLSLIALIFFRITARADTSLGFNEAQGTTVHDTSGTLTGTLTGATWKTGADCVKTACLYFDGTSDYITMADNAALDFADSDSFTLVAWFRHNSAISSIQTILAKYNADAGYKLYMDATGHIVFAIDDDSTWGPDHSVTSASTYADNQWHVITAVKTGTTGLYLYIDGKATGTPDTDINTSATLANSRSLYIGIDGDGSSTPWIGFLDEIQILRSSQTSSQAKNFAQPLSSLNSSGSSATFGRTDSNLSTGLVGYWKMDEAAWGAPTCTSSTGVVADSSGNGDPLVACPATTGPVGGTAGKFGNGVDLDGSDYLEINVPNAVLNLTGPMSFSLWVKPNGAQNDNDRLIDNNYAAGYALGIGSGSGRDLSLYFANTGVIDTGEVLTDNVWQHVVATYDGTTAVMYVNDVEVGRGTYTGTITGNTGNIGIGASHTGSWPFTGSLDEIRIYNRGLSPAEVQQLYNWAPGPVGYWKFDENTSTLANDSSGNNLVGTLGGGTAGYRPAWVSGKFGSALSFDGTDDYVEAADNNLYSSGFLTAEAWVNFRQIDKEQAIIRHTSNDSPYYSFNLYLASDAHLAGQVANQVSTSAFIQTATTISANTWYHVALVWDGSNINIYLNGTKAASAAALAGTSLKNADATLTIGAKDASSRQSNGLIDDVRLYNYARTPAQIAQDMAGNNPADSPSLSNPILSYNFNEGYGDTAHNLGSGGSSLNGDLASSGTACPTTGACPTWTNSGKFGSALSFDYVDDYVDAGSNSAIDIDGKSFSFSLWAKRGAISSDHFILNKGYLKNSDNSLDVFFVGATNKLRFGFYGDDLDSVQTFTSTSDWYFITLTYDADTNMRRIYVNGKLDIQDTASGDLNSTDNYNLFIGKHTDATPWSAYYNGSIDELKMFNFAITADQVKILYNQSSSAVIGAVAAVGEYCPPGDTGTCNPPVGYWKLDENTGATIFDVSGNNNTGTITGAKWATGKFGSALNFSNGNVDVVNAGSGSSIANPFDAGGTYEAWIYPRSDGGGDNGRIIYKGGYKDFYVSSESAGYVYLNLNVGFSTTPGIWYTSNIIPINKWTHVAVTYNNDSTNNDPIMYINGQPVSITEDSTPNGTRRDTTAHPLYLGNYEDPTSLNHVFDGLLDEVKVYRYIRSPAQIAWDMNQGAPIAQYDFNECTGSILHDIHPQPNKSGVGLDGTITPNSGRSTGTCNSGTSTEMWNGGTTGKYGSSLEFDGVGDYVTVADNDKLSFGNSSTNMPFSISAWVKIDDATNNTIIAKYDATTGNTKREYWLYTDSSKYLTFAIYDESAGGYIIRYQGSAFPESSWHHVTATYNGAATSAGISIYLDGKRVDTAGTGGGSFSTIDNTAAPLMIGYIIGTAGTRSLFHDGLMDSIKIYNYALTAEQIKILYNNNSSVQF